LDTVNANYSEVKNKYDVHLKIVTTLTTDRDRYHKLYQEENEIRLRYEAKGDVDKKLLYAVQ